MGGCGGEGNHVKRYLLMKLVNELNKAYFGDSVLINIRFNYDTEYLFNCSIGHGRQYNIGYNVCRAQEFVNEDSTTQKMFFRSCLSLYCIADNINVGDCLKLINYALSNAKEIHRKQYKNVAHTIFQPYRQAYDSFYIMGAGKLYNGYEPLYTISPTEISNIINNDYSQLDTFLDQKFFRHKTGILPSPLGLIDYYVQNEQYYICDAKALKPIFVFPNIDRVVSDSNNNYLIFTQGDTFYHIILDQLKLIGPLKFPLISQSFYGKGFNFQENMYSLSQDTLIIKAETLFGEYSVIYDMKHGKLQIDAGRTPHDVFLAVKGYEEDERPLFNHSESSKPKIENLSHRYFIMSIVFTIVILLNLFLVYSKRL